MLSMVNLPNIITHNKYCLQFTTFMCQVVWELSGFTGFLSQFYILLNKQSGYDIFTSVCADSSETPPS